MENRIKMIMEVYNLSSSKFADIISVQPSAVSHLVSGRNKPSFDILSKIAKAFPDLNFRWLMLGEGKMHNDPVPVKENPMQSEGNGNVDLFTTGTLNPENSSQETKQVEILTQNSAHISGPTVPPTEIPEISTGKKIDKIVLFYSDGTFKDYQPE